LTSPAFVVTKSFNIFGDTGAPSFLQGELAEVHAVMSRSHRWVSGKDSIACSAIEWRIASEFGDDEAESVSSAQQSSLTYWPNWLLATLEISAKT